MKEGYPAVERLYAQLCKKQGTTKELANRAGVNRTYAGELMLWLLHKGKAKRRKLPHTKAFLWEKT